MTQKIPVRPLGGFGENVSALGLGLGALARKRDASTWAPTVHAAMEAGIRCFDAAQGVERRASEERLGEIVADVRDELFLSTRCSPLDGEPFDASGREARAQLENSLRRLGTDRIDLYYAHDVEASGAKKILGETLPTLIEARERGDVRYVGASGASLEILHEIVVGFPVDAILSYARMDLVSTELRDVVLPAAFERGIAVINASPLHMGLLADPAVSRPGASEGEPLAVAAARAFRLAKEHGVELARLAIEFASDEERIATTFVGCATPVEVRENVDAFVTPATEEEQSAIQGVRALFDEAEGAGHGRGRY